MKDPEAKDPQQSDHFPDSFYRLAVKGLYVQEGKLLLCHDFDLSDREPIWELPGGGLDFGEEPRDALKREIKEEMNLDVTYVSNRPIYIWSGKRTAHRGMDWYWFLILGYRFEVENLDRFKPTDECREYSFFSAEELRNLPDLSPQLKPLAHLFDSKDFGRGEQ